jgi:hypothetical protein
MLMTGQERRNGLELEPSCTFYKFGEAVQDMLLYPGIGPWRRHCGEDVH